MVHEYLFHCWCFYSWVPDHGHTRCLSYADVHQEEVQCEEVAFVPMMSSVRAYWPLGVMGSVSVAGDVKKGFVLSSVGTERPDIPMWVDKYNPEPDPYRLYNPYQHSHDCIHVCEYPNPYTDLYH